MITQFFANGGTQCVHCVRPVHTQQRDVLPVVQTGPGTYSFLTFVDIISQSTASIPSGPANTGFSQFDHIRVYGRNQKVAQGID